MTDGLGALEKGELQKLIGPATIPCYLRESVGVAFCTSNHFWTAVGRKMYLGRYLIE
jgi:hypothetical protein